MALIANELSARGWQISLVSQQGKASDPPFFCLDPRISLRRLDFATIGREAFKKTGRIRQLMALRAAIRLSEPDVVVSFMDTVNVRTLLSTIGLGTPVIVAEHCDPRIREIGAWWQFLRRTTYKVARAIIVLSDEAMTFFSIRDRRIAHVIPNPVMTPPTDQGPGAVRTRTIISVGRLHPVKGFDRLLSAFALVAHKHPDWNLEIWGEGSERAQLEQWTKTAGLDTRISFCGQTHDVYGALQRAEIFALTSHTEGFPMSLGEAMACGLACVSFDCPSGPRQLIRNDVDGRLVADGDIEGLAATLDQLVSDDRLRERLGRAAIGVTERFSLTAIIDRWESLLTQATTDAPIRLPPG